MRSSKKVPGTTIKSRVLELLETNLVLTATEAAHKTGSHWSSTSSLLYKLMQKGVVDRIPNFGPLKGYGYFLRKNAKKIGKVKLEQVPSNPYCEYDCPTCGESRNGYENHHCPGLCPNTGERHRWDTDCSYGPEFCKTCGRRR